MYHKLSAEFYHLDPTYPPDLEVAFFSYFLEHSVPGPWLEAMSGAGRVLIPLLQKGFVIEGVDNSPSMLDLCSNTMQQKGVDTQLYDQSVIELSLPKKYSGIIICFASFQLLPDREIAMQTLVKLKEHLLPGGMLIIDIYVPWESIKKAMRAGVLLRHAYIKDVPVQRVQSGNGQAIERATVLDVYAHDQYVLSSNTYTKYDAQGAIIATEEEKMIFMWYYRHEFVYMLEKVGFKTVNVIDLTDEMVAYQALMDSE